MMKVHNADEIRRKDSIPEADRTPARDEVAEHIEKNILQEGRWPMSLTAIASEVDYSRQHVANTIDAYFEPVLNIERINDETNSAAQELNRKLNLDINIPNDVDPESYVRGFVRGVLESGE